MYMLCDYFIVLKFYSPLQKKIIKHGDKLQFAITHFLQILNSIKYKTFFVHSTFIEQPDL